MDERFDRVMYQRDFRLTDNPYIMNVSDISNISFVCTPSSSLPATFVYNFVDLILFPYVCNMQTYTFNRLVIFKPIIIFKPSL